MILYAIKKKNMYFSSLLEIAWHDLSTAKLFDSENSAKLYANSLNLTDYSIVTIYLEEVV